MEKKLFLGIDFFSDISKRGCYYVDKTGLIAELLKHEFGVMLFTRPRRFGKTLALTMLEDFFAIDRQSAEHFAGLKIAEEKELCAEWMNRWPVLFLTLKSVEGLSFSSAYGSLEMLVYNLCQKYKYLGQSDRVEEEDKKLFADLLDFKATKEKLCDFLRLLLRMMKAHFGREAILLIDEYDVPLAKANENGYYREMLEVIRKIFDPLKSNGDLRFAVITGCLRVSKESIFTGMNNLVTDTISDERFDEYFGFTREDVEKVLADFGFEDHMEEIKSWYDGYRFGSVNVYCPWDVMNYVAALQTNPKAKPKPYWANTSGNVILKQVLKKAGRSTKTELERLIAGESVFKEITEQLTYDTIGESVANLWSVLYLTGYLTMKGMDDDGRVELRIPNEEIRQIMIRQISLWFTETIVADVDGGWSELCKALETGDAKCAEERLNGILAKSISIRDTAVRKAKKENFYHGLLLGLLVTRDEWNAYSNHEDGDGYSDIHVECEKVAFIIELKYAEDDALDAACEAAMRQIKEKQYEKDLLVQGYRTVFAYGVACHKKHCQIVCRQIK